MARLRTEAIQHLSFGAMPSSIVGTGQRAVGQCELVNPTDQNVFVRTVPVWSDHLRDRNGAPLREMSLMRTIPAGSTASLPMRLRLHPQTPPGDYTVAVMLGEQRRELRVQVPERRQIRLVSTQLSLVGEPRAKLTQSLGVTNQGNVPFQVGKPGAVILEESGGVCRSVQASLRSTGEQGYNAFLDSLVAELATTRVDMLRVRILEDVTTVAPGETRSIPLEFHLPADLKPGRRYFGRLDLGTQTINILVMTQGRSPGSPEPG